MTEVDTSAEAVERAKAAYDALSPVDKALHDSDQRRSFVRGMAGDPGPDVLAEEVRRLRADRDRLAAENAKLRAALEKIKAARFACRPQQMWMAMQGEAERALTGDTPMTDAPNSWPDPAREAVARAIAGRLPRDAAEYASRIADDVFLALAPFVAAREAAAQAMREACAQWLADRTLLFGDQAAGAMRDLPLPAPDALARIEAAAEARGMGRAATVLERRARSCRPHPSYEAKEPLDYEKSVAVADELESQAATIRAAAKEIKA